MQVFSLWRTKCVLVLEYHAAQVHNVHISDLPFVAISLIWFDPGPLSFCVSRFFFVKLHSNVSNAWQASFPCSCVARDARQSGLLTLDSLSPPPACPPGDTSLYSCPSSFLQWCTCLLWGNISPGMKVPISPFCHWLLLIRRGDPTCLPSTLSVPKQCPVATQCHSCQLGI